ncbi:sce7725 family protein [Erythrobacteraceae bacterium WH01K]|nr:sce7725 family protein [Erythrobacteraceae bacterium WH01K]
MYYPYFRGKQFDLIAIRDTAEVMASSDFVPIIEPVRDNLRGLHRALEAVCEAGGEAIVVVNPYHGDLSEDGEPISSLLAQEFQEFDSITAGIFLSKDTLTEHAMELYNAHQGHDPIFIHAGFRFAGQLAQALGDDLETSKHVFFERHSEVLYRNHFASAGHKVLLRDGFDRQKNADYPEVEKFSELHLTFQSMGMQGFGDFLIVGDEFVEGGGPAYAVAIHVTFIDADDENIMYVHHFLSEDRSTPTDPAGKFGQALSNLIDHLDSDQSQIFESSAIEQFRDLHAEEHFPGLGQVKKLSMIHHIETLADFLS